MRPLRRHKPQREGNIKMELRKVDWINLSPYRDIWRAVLDTVIPFVLYVHSFSNLSDDRSKASSKTIPPHSAI